MNPVCLMHFHRWGSKARDRPGGERSRARLRQDPVTERKRRFRLCTLYFVELQGLSPCPNRPSVGFGRRQNQGIHQIYIIPRFSLLVASAMSLSV